MGDVSAYDWMLQNISFADRPYCRGSQNIYNNINIYMNKIYKNKYKKKKKKTQNDVVLV
jgi:hypothetical protein